MQQILGRRQRERRTPMPGEKDQEKDDGIDGTRHRQRRATCVKWARKERNY